MTTGYSYYKSVNIRHEVTEVIMDDIEAAYERACESSGEGCHMGFSAYEYDGLTSIAKMFRSWIYDRGNSLDQLALNATATRELYTMM